MVDPAGDLLGTARAAFTSGLSAILVAAIAAFVAAAALLVLIRAKDVHTPEPAGDAQEETTGWVQQRGSDGAGRRL